MKKFLYILLVSALLKGMSLAQANELERDQRIIDAADTCYIAMAIEEMAFDSMAKIWYQMRDTWNVTEIEQFRADWLEASIIAEKASNKRRVLCAKAATM